MFAQGLGYGLSKLKAGVKVSHTKKEGSPKGGGLKHVLLWRTLFLGSTIFNETSSFSFIFLADQVKNVAVPLTENIAYGILPNPPSSNN